MVRKRVASSRAPTAKSTRGVANGNPVLKSQWQLGPKVGNYPAYLCVILSGPCRGNKTSERLTWVRNHGEPAMTINEDDIIEWRVPSASELAAMVKCLREENKWTQATLAEIAKVTERTIQRVERGEPSNLDTRRALCGAFGFKDLDTFDKPLPFPDVEKWKAYEQELEKSTVLVPIIRIEEGRNLRLMIEGAESSVTQEIGRNTEEAREAFAQIVDYLRDYNDIRHAYAMSQRLGVDKDIDDLLRIIKCEGSALGAGLRTQKVSFKSDAPGTAPMDWTNIFFIVAPAEALPEKIRVPKQPTFDWG